MAILLGTGGSNQISGINSISGLATHSGPPIPVARLNFNYDALLEAEELLANEDALMGRLAWIVSPRIRRYGRETAELATAPHARSGAWDGCSITRRTSRRKYPPRLDSLANWEEMMAGMWGGIDVLVNPYSKDREGVVRITTGQMCDVASRHDESFCKISKAA